MHGAFSRSDPVWMAWRENEALAPVVDEHARPWTHKTAAIGMKERIDEADRIALFIDDGD
jgi:hypothetical protein